MQVKLKKAIFIILIGLALLFVAKVLGHFFPEKNNFYNFWHYGDIMNNEFLLEDTDAIKLDKLDFTQIENFEISAKKNLLRIINTDKFAIKTKIPLKEIHIKQKGNHLLIQTETGTDASFGSFFNFFGFKKKAILQIEIPQNSKLKSFLIKSGIGKIDLKNLEVESFNIKVEVADINIKDLFVAEEFEFKTGVGELNLKNALIYNANLDMGIGSLNFNGDLYGENKIGAGIGEIKLNLARARHNYYIDSHINIGSQNQFNKNSNAKDKIKLRGVLGEIKLNYGSGSGL